MNLQSTEPEFILAEQEEMLDMENKPNSFVRDFAQVVVDLEQLQEQSRISVAMSLDIARCIQELVRSLQEQV